MINFGITDKVREAVGQNHGSESDTSLVAYVVTDADKSIAQDRISRLLKQKLDLKYLFAFENWPTV